MAERSWYHMRDDKKPVGVFQLADDELEPLRAKGWLIVPMALVKEDVHGHFHVIDEHGRLIGQRMLDAVQAGEHLRLGHHLIHVGDASKDMQEVRAVQASIAAEKASSEATE